MSASASGWEPQQMEQAVLVIAKILMDGAKLGTRFLRNKPKPIVTLRLDTATASTTSETPRLQSTCLRVDYEGLRLLQRQLETALKEVESMHCSRIQRYMH
ncbi:hypothetical protein BBJ28_00008367 [Nothophytophthora sp. Chile5]|nr:hypothetical protein BBJ28_00008367 [Nothophytophthora sp. Chile5]